MRRRPARAVRQFLRVDLALLKNDVAETALAHRLAAFLDSEFPRIDVIKCHGVVPLVRWCGPKERTVIRPHCMTSPCMSRLGPARRAHLEAGAASL